MNQVAKNLILGFTFAAAFDANAGEALIIRGDQSISLLSQLPVQVNSAPQIFSVQPRLTAREEMILILGNAELFISPPIYARTAEGDETNQNSNKKITNVQSGEGQ